jgi:hypothetical protein
MSELPERAIDLTQLATYTNKIGEIASISKMMAPVFLRDFIIGQDVATTLLSKAMYAESKSKAKLEYAESIAYLENAKGYLEAKGIKDTSEARKQYICIDPDVVKAKEQHGQAEALVFLLRGKLSELRQGHDDLKKIAYGDQNLTPYEGA